MIGLERMRKMVAEGSREVVKNEDYLCELDSFVGDGDHGVTAARGFCKVIDELDEKQFETIGTFMTSVGKTLGDSMGGAIGPIIGSVFRGAGYYAGDKTELSKDEFAAMMRAGCEAVKKLGGAKPGDRTLVDALEAAVVEMEKEGDFQTVLQRAAKAAWIGAESTKNMVAKKGRARFLGEKSLGHQDAGATTFAIFIGAMSKGEES